jgi:hypothetical protein
MRIISSLDSVIWSAVIMARELEDASGVGNRRIEVIEEGEMAVREVTA